MIAAARNFDARMACLAEALAFVEDFCQRKGVGRGDLLRLTLVVEELFTNAVEHGHGGEGDATIRLELSAGSAELALLYEDAAAPFDALAHLAQQPPPLGETIDTRPVGGLGIHLVEQIAEGIRYAREGGRNRLWVVLRRGT